eukprot:9272715-Alexandrium_andersonii.AAC.1
MLLNGRASDEGARNGVGGDAVRCLVRPNARARAACGHAPVGHPTHELCTSKSNGRLLARMVAPCHGFICTTH